MRTLALDSGAGANLLEVAPLPSRFSYSQFDVYERCPLQYAFRHVYRFPEPEGRGALTFGSTAHAAFERFTRERRERAARGEAAADPRGPCPVLRGGVEARRVRRPGGRGRLPRARSAPLHRLVLRGRARRRGRGRSIARGARLRAGARPGRRRRRRSSSTARSTGSTGSPRGGIEVIDYKTGRVSTQKGVDESLQLSIYALACRDALGLGTPERVTLYFTESATRMTTTRTDEALDAARADILARAARIRSGDFAATPSSSRTCGWCDFRAMCPARVV